MTSTSTFYSRPEMYAKNLASGEGLRVTKAVLAHRDGKTQGVAVFRDNYFMFCLTAEHAWRLADQLADALDGLSEGTAA